MGHPLCFDPSNYSGETAAETGKQTSSEQTSSENGPSGRISFPFVFIYK